MSRSSYLIKSETRIETILKVMDAAFMVPNLEDWVADYLNAKTERKV